MNPEIEKKFSVLGSQFSVLSSQSSPLLGSACKSRVFKGLLGSPRCGRELTAES